MSNEVLHLLLEGKLKRGMRVFHFTMQRFEPCIV